MNTLSAGIDFYRLGYEHFRIGLEPYKPITGYRADDEVAYYDGRLYAERCASTGLHLPQWPVGMSSAPRQCWKAFIAWARADNERRRMLSNGR